MKQKKRDARADRSFRNSARAGWYVVTVSAERKTAIESDHWAMLKWINENSIEKFTSVYRTDGSSNFGFREEQDAVFFSLRWS